MPVSLSLFGHYVQPHLQWVQHTLPGDNDLLGLLLYGQRANQSSYLLSCLPFR